MTEQAWSKEGFTIMANNNRSLEQPIRRQGFASLRPAAARSRVQPYFIAIYINIQQTSFPSLNRRTLSIQWRTSLIMGSSLAMSADLVLLPLDGTNKDNFQWINLARFSNDCLLIISDSSPVGGQNARNVRAREVLGRKKTLPFFFLPITPLTALRRLRDDWGRFSAGCKENHFYSLSFGQAEASIY